jgi:hypothetical protein
MKVWLAAYGYDYEGPDNVVGIFSSEDKAIEALKEYETYGDWQNVSEWVLDEQS